VHLGGHAESL